jgi:hypothetical protein
MDLYYASAEQPQYLRTLESLGVRHVAVSYYEWERRHPTTQGADLLRKHIPEEFSIIVTPGVARKEMLDYSAFAQRYVQFCEHNCEDALVFDLDAQHCPERLRREVRKHLAFLPNLVAFPTENETHLDLAAEFERVGVNASAGKSIPVTELRRIPASLYGSNITDPKLLAGGRFVATTSFAWLSGRRYGELWLYIRGHLRHFGAAQLGRAVRSYRAEIEALGVDPEAALANDKTALTEIAVRSLQLMADSLSGRPRDRVNAEIAAISASEAPEAAQEPPVLPGAPLPAPGPQERPRVTLPVLRTEGQLPRANTASMRQCDSCNLAEVCPQYKAQASCAFDIPIEIKTDADWEAAVQTVIEWQFSRVAHGVFAEQVNGGELMAATGREMDRFTKLLTQLKELKRIDSEEGGALSRILAEVIPQPEPPNGHEEVEDAEVIEDEEVEFSDVGITGWEADQPPES